MTARHWLTTEANHQSSFHSFITCQTISVHRIGATEEDGCRLTALHQRQSKMILDRMVGQGRWVGQVVPRYETNGAV